MTYVQKELKYKVITTMSRNQNVWISTIQLMGNYSEIIICNVYHSPNKSDGQFINDIITECDKLVDIGQVILLGDFNIDVNKENQYTRRLIQNLGGMGFKQYVKEYTRITETSNTTIDLVFSNFYTITEVLKTPKITDHQIITVNIKKQDDPRNKITEFYKRDFQNFDEKIFNDGITNDIKKCNEKETVDSIANNIVKCITDNLELTAPKIKKQIPIRWRDKPWISTEVREARAKRDNAYKNALINKSVHSENVKRNWKEYKRMRNIVVETIRRNKRKYYEDNIDAVKTNPTKMWKTIKSLVVSRSNDKNTKGISFNGKIYQDEESIANKFNEFFLQSIDEIVGTDTEEDTNDLNLEMEVQTVFYKFRDINREEIDEIVFNMKNKNGSEEGISTKILQTAWRSIGNIMLVLVNRSLQKGTFPENWKTSTIIPIPKIAGTIKAGEYRPINILPLYEKILEIAVKNQIIEYIDLYNILVNEQSGFRKTYSCETALQSTIIEWRRNMDEGEVVGVIFLDFKRAFETINRKKLLNKLDKYGIRGAPLKWLKSYLENRSQQVKYGNSISEKKTTTHGVPQGSVLGPLLFILYINDIINQLKYCKCKMFADDTVIFISDKNISEVEWKINTDLLNVVSWFNHNALRLNTTKTKSMAIHDPRKRYIVNYCDIKINGIRIEEVKEIKYLGVTIDNNLNFNSHATYVIKKTVKKVNFMYRINKYISKSAMTTIYKTIVAPHFKYCISILLNCSHQSLEGIQKIQNRAMRAILRCDKYARVRDMLNELKFLTIRQELRYNVCILVYKMVKGITPTYLTDEIQLVEETHNYHTRQRQQLKLRKCRTGGGQKCLTYAGFDMYNKLPTEIKAAESLNEFKTRLKQHISVEERDAR